jgi:hypothetical protein
MDVLREIQVFVEPADSNELCAVEYRELEVVGPDGRVVSDRMAGSEARQVRPPASGAG